MGLGLGLGLGLHQSLEQKLEIRQGLGLEQKLELKQILALRQTLRHPEIPNAARGKEGIKSADSILKELSATGILIGGLAEEFWREPRTEHDLEEHKDVDVLVLSKNKLPQALEGGIDWWLPKEELLKVRSGAGLGYAEIRMKWWQNVNNIVLSFKVNNDFNNLEPGLYLPTVDWLIAMRMAEIESLIDSEIVSVAEGVLEAAEKELRKKLNLKNKNRSEAKELFSGHGLIHNTRSRQAGETNFVEVQFFNLRDIVAINSLYNNSLPVFYETKPEVNFSKVNNELRQNFFYDAVDDVIRFEVIRSNLISWLDKKALTVDLNEQAVFVGSLLSFFDRGALNALNQQIKKSTSKAEREQLAERQIELLFQAGQKFSANKLRGYNKNLFCSIFV